MRLMDDVVEGPGATFAATRGSIPSDAFGSHINAEIREAQGGNALSTHTLLKVPAGHARQSWPV